MYEHHKKDADGNSIPHEGEELNEAPFLAALAPMLAKAGAVAGKVGAATAKAGVKVGAKLGGKTGANIAKSVARDPMGAIDKVGRASFAAQQVGSLIPKPKMSGGGGGVSGGMTKTVTAGADLFDIVKGQLLDEGLSEEEIIDIMLTLTPDEIMSEMAVNPNIAAMDAKNKADMVARAKAKEVPQDVKDASKRQYTAGGPKDKGENKYTTQDKKTIIDYNKNK